jgi:hypothetical protein
MEHGRGVPSWVQLVAAFFRESKLSETGALLRLALYVSAAAALATIVAAEAAHR